MVIVTVGLIAGTGTAAAWHAEPSATFVCVIDEQGGFHVGLNWGVSSWRPDEPQGENPRIIVELSLDGVTFAPLGSGGFTPDTGYGFGGSVTLPDGTAALTLRTSAAAPWGDGTVDPGIVTRDFAVPTVEQIGDPRCQGAEKPHEDKQTPTPAPTPTPTPSVVPSATPTVAPEPTPTAPAPQPTPTAEVAPATPTAEPTQSPPTATPDAEVLPKVLARTGGSSGGLAFIGATLIGAGGLLLAGLHLQQRRTHRAPPE